jgi:hypothetical protein
MKTRESNSSDIMIRHEEIGTQGGTSRLLRYSFREDDENESTAISAKETLNWVLCRKVGPTSVTPIHGYPMDRRSLSLATVRYSESGRHAGLGQLLAKAARGKSARCKFPKRRCIRLLMPILDLPGNRCLTGGQGIRSSKWRERAHKGP